MKRGGSGDGELRYGGREWAKYFYRKINRKDSDGTGRDQIQICQRSFWICFTFTLIQWGDVFEGFRRIEWDFSV